VLRTGSVLFAPCGPFSHPPCEEDEEEPFSSLLSPWTSRAAAVELWELDFQDFLGLKQAQLL